MCAESVVNKTMTLVQALGAAGNSSAHKTKVKHAPPSSPVDITLVIVLLVHGTFLVRWAPLLPTVQYLRRHTRSMTASAFPPTPASRTTRPIDNRDRWCAHGIRRARGRCGLGEWNGSVAAIIGCHPHMASTHHLDAQPNTTQQTPLPDHGSHGHHPLSDQYGRHDHHRVPPAPTIPNTHPQPISTIGSSLALPTTRMPMPTFLPPGAIRQCHGRRMHSGAV